MGVISNLPTPGGDNDTWGSENNAALTELDNGKADVTSVYTKSETVALIGTPVRTVNDTEPDENGNVVVAVGDEPPVTSVNDLTGEITLTAADVDAVAIADRGVAGGVATLDDDGLIPIAQLPGDSSYQVWLDVGHSGTKEDYIAFLVGEQGDPGDDGATGASYFSGVFDEEVPVTNDVTRIWRPLRDIEIDPEIWIYSNEAVLCATPIKLTILADGVDQLGGSGFWPSITTGNAKASVTLGSPITIAAGKEVQVSCESMGPAVAPSPASPAARATPGTNTSGSGAVTSLTVPMTTGTTLGDLAVLIQHSSTAPTAAPSGWSQLGSTHTDVNNFVYVAVYYKTATGSDTDPVLSYATNTTVSAVCMSFPGTELVAPFDLDNWATTSTGATSFNSPTGTTGAYTNETALVIYANRYGSGTSSSVTTDGALTEIVDIVTARTGSSNNFGLCVAYLDVASASTAISAYTATVGTTSSRAAMGLVTLRPASAASSPGSYPYLTARYTETS